MVKSISKEEGKTYSGGNVSNGISLQAETNLTYNRTSEKDFAAPGEILTQSLTLTNNSASEIYSIFVKDYIPDGVSFDPSTVSIGGASFPTYDPNTGFYFRGTLPTGHSQTMTYSIKVADPISDEITSLTLYSDINYGINGGELTQKSNETKIDIAFSEISISKTTDKSAVISGQKLVFQSVIKNIGTLEDSDVFFEDTLPQGVKFVDGSVKIDGVLYLDYDPNIGFDLGTIPAKSQKTITFEVTVD